MPTVATKGDSTMISGAHVMLYSNNADADREFIRDVLGLGHVDAGGGWLIFGLPPAEVAVHPADEMEKHELYLMCEDVEAFVLGMTAQSVPCAPVRDQGWGVTTEVTLPGGGKLGVYEPRHVRPKPAARVSASRKRTKRASRAVSKRSATRKSMRKKTRGSR